MPLLRWTDLASSCPSVKASLSSWGQWVAHSGLGMISGWYKYYLWKCCYMMSKRYNLKEWTENRSILQTWENRNELFVLFFHRELITQSRERVKSINSHRHNRQSFKRASHNFYKFTFLQSDVIFNTIFWNCNSPVATILWQKKLFSTK